MINIEISDRQQSVDVDRERLRQAVTCILQDAGVERAAVSLAVVTDPAIHDLNRRYLDHDYPTDVLSFLLEREQDFLEGEVIVSAETAAAQAAVLGWPAADELLLYVVHGTLHLVGYDDQTDEQRRLMRRQEREVLERFGIRPPDDRDTGAVPSMPGDPG